MLFRSIAPDELKMPDYIKHDVCEVNGLDYVEVDNLEAAMPELDVLYMTRVQKERFAVVADYERLKDSFILDAAKMQLGKVDMIVLHPLPRVNEIAVEVDADSRAAYFRQVENGKYVRMALIYQLLKWKEQGVDAPLSDEEIVAGPRCWHAACITSIEPVEPLYLVKSSGDKRCVYCETKLTIE